MKTLFATLAIGLAIITAPAAAADTTTSESPATVQCSTWQYVTDPGMPIYYGPGTEYGRKDTTRNQGFVNVTMFSGNWRGGNFYTDPGPVWYTSGWINVTHIHYVGCW